MSCFKHTTNKKYLSYLDYHNIYSQIVWVCIFFKVIFNVQLHHIFLPIFLYPLFPIFTMASQHNIYTNTGNKYFSLCSYSLKASPISSDFSILYMVTRIYKYWKINSMANSKMSSISHIRKVVATCWFPSNSQVTVSAWVLIPP